MVQIQTRNNVNIIGEGQQVVILAHGFGCDQQMWQYMTPQFLRDYRLVLFDYVGSGHSDIHEYKSEKYKNLSGYAQDVIDIIHSCELQNVIFIGHSISSMIGMLAAIEEPEAFSKIIMIGPSPCYLNDGDYVGGFEKTDIDELLTTMEMNFTGWASYMAPLAADVENGSVVTKKVEQSFVSNNPQVAREFAEVTFFSDYRTVVHELTVPTLIIQCSNDSIVPVEVGYYLDQQIPHSELVILDVRGHYPHVSHPIETAEIIKQFLKNS